MRTNKVSCVDDKTKKSIFDEYTTKNEKNKTKLGKKYGVSARTIGRIVDEMSGIDTTEETKPKVWDYCVTKNEITVFCDGEARTVNQSFFNFKHIKSMLAVNDYNDASLEEAFIAMCMKKVIETFSEGNITVDHENGKIWYGAFEVKNSLVNQIFKLLEEGRDVLPMVRFLDKLMENPKKDIIEELYGFMKHNKIGLFDDGDIKAYKGVRSDYYDVYSNTIDNSVGRTPRMPRSEVEYNPSRACGAGLHSGSYEYAKGWGVRVMITKINPRDVVSVPYDVDGQKMRTCGYTVIEEVFN